MSVPVGGAGRESAMDGTYVQDCARQLGALAREAAAAAARVAAVDAVEWRSVAAERFRAALQHEAALGRQCAQLLDEAAAAFAAAARAITPGAGR
jgi:hypothetical protein